MFDESSESLESEEEETEGTGDLFRGASGVHPIAHGPISITSPSTSGLRPSELAIAGDEEVVEVKEVEEEQAEEEDDVEVGAVEEEVEVATVHDAVVEEAFVNVSADVSPASTRPASFFFFSMQTSVCFAFSPILVVFERVAFISRFPCSPCSWST